MAAKATGERDPLTGALGYEVFGEVFELRAAEADREQKPLSLAMVDLDGFDRVNRDHGRAAGDEVLRAATRHLQDVAGQRGRVFRYGGDEFLILLPGVEKEQAFLILESARRNFDRTHALEVEGRGVTLGLAFSVGVVSYPDDDTRAQGLLRKASDAVHRAKARGGNAVCLAREERMVTKTSHYTQGQLDRLSALAKREGVGEAVLLREALDDLLRKSSL